MATAQKILVVEDELALQELYKDILPEYELTQVSTGREALNLIEKPFDLYIVDVGLPDTDGFSVISAIRERFPKSKIVIETGFPLKSLQPQFDRAHADLIVAKPFKIKELKEHIVQLMN